MARVLIKNLPITVTAKEVHMMFAENDCPTQPSKVFVPSAKKGHDRNMAFIEVRDEFMDLTIDWVNSVYYDQRKLRAEVALVNPVKLYIGNIPFSIVTGNQLGAAISEQSGVKVYCCDLSYSKSHQPRGFGFIMVEADQADDILNKTISIGGRTLKINPYIKKERPTNVPG